MLLGESANLLMDVLLECLGNWYRHSSVTAETPRQVIEKLGARYVDIRTFLVAGGDPRELDVSMLSAPNSTGFRRG